MIDDPTKLYKMIQENEAREGYGARMDKKSLMRILTKLGNDNHIKNITVELKLQDKIKVNIFLQNKQFILQIYKFVLS